MGNDKNGGGRAAAVPHLHGTGWNQRYISHEGAEANQLPHWLHEALPGVLGDVLWDVGVVGHNQGDGQHLGVQDGREYQQPCSANGS